MKDPHAQEEVKLSITPMIDVTFLLLIFFMCAMKFKALDYKLQAWLPTKQGLANTPIKIADDMRITVRLLREAGETSTRVRVLDAEVGRDEAQFVAMSRRIRAIHSTAPEFEGEIDAGGEVPHEEVVRALDSFLAAGIEDVHFIGAPKHQKGR